MMFVWWMFSDRSITGKISHSDRSLGTSGDTIAVVSSDSGVSE